MDAGEGLYKRFILDYRGGEAVRAYVDGAELTRYATVGVVTPDHTIRTKNTPLILPPCDKEFAAGAKAAMEAFVVDYEAYFARHRSGHTALDSIPRVMLAPGLGLFGLGETAR